MDLNYVVAAGALCLGLVTGAFSAACVSVPEKPGMLGPITNVIGGVVVLAALNFLASPPAAVVTSAPAKADVSIWLFPVGLLCGLLVGMKGGPEAWTRKRQNQTDQVAKGGG